MSEHRILETELQSSSEASPTESHLRVQQQGRERSEAFRVHVRGVMTSITEEIVKNAGVYPHNNGALSLTELARRANVHVTSFFSPRQRNFGLEVKRWLNKQKEAFTIGRGRVRRNVLARVADWSAKYEGLAQSHRDTELALQDMTAERDKVRSELEEIRRENERLLSLLGTTTSANVMSLRKPRGK